MVPVNNQVLYHYTTEAGFRAILGSKQLWMRQATALNDTTEIVHFTRHLESMLAGRQFQFPEVEDTIRGFIRSITPERFGIASFSGARDYLTMWRLYGDNTKGLAIGFHSDGLKKVQKRTTKPRDIVLRAIQDVMLEPVRYEESPGRVMLEQCLGALPRKAKIDTKFEKVRWDLMRLACSLKDTSYQQEQEIRLIKHFRDYYEGDDRLYEPGFLGEHYDRIDGYLVYKHDFLPNQIREVTLGCNCPLTEKDVHELLRERSFPSTVSVTRSRHRHRI